MGIRRPLYLHIYIYTHTHTHTHTYIHLLTYIYIHKLHIFSHASCDNFILQYLAVLSIGIYLSALVTISQEFLDFAVGTIEGIICVLGGGINTLSGNILTTQLSFHVGGLSL